MVGLFAANSINDDDIEVYVDDTRRAVTATLHTLRQQDEKPAGKPNRALADFVAPKQTGRKDYLGGFAVSIHGADELAKQHERRHDDYRAIMVKALADRLRRRHSPNACTSACVGEFWGYGSAENLTNDALIREEYKGIRPAPGYPACPDHTEKAALFSLVEATAKTGVKLTESFAMWPAAAVSGFYFSHPESQYFAVGKLGRDQVEDYARRKGMDLATIEKWLSPNLGYEPGER